MYAPLQVIQRQSIWGRTF